MTSVFSLVAILVAWGAGTLRIPQRWFPVNPFTAAVRSAVDDFEKRLIADLKSNMMNGGNQSTPPPQN